MMADASYPEGPKMAPTPDSIESHAKRDTIFYYDIIRWDLVNPKGLEDYHTTYYNAQGEVFFPAQQ